MALTGAGPLEGTPVVQVMPGVFMGVLVAVAVALGLLELVLHGNWLMLNSMHVLLNFTMIF